MTIVSEGRASTAAAPAPSDSAVLTEVGTSLLTVAGGHIDSPEWVAAARDGWDSLPAALRMQLRRFRRDSGPDGVLLLKGMPVNEATLPPTPTVEGSTQKIASLPAAVLAMVACGLGDPVSYLPEKSGALVQDVVPVPGKEQVQGNTGSTLLTFHTENAFHPHRPDYVLLLCLRADHDGVAGLRSVCIRRVVSRLSPSARDALSRAQFVTAPPPSFGAGTPTTPHAVLQGSPEDPDLLVDFAATRALTPAAGEGLAELGALLDRFATTTRLRPGDLVVVDNRVTVHGRSAFTPRYDGADRWLQRTFVSTDLRRCRSLRPDDGYVQVS